GLDVYAQHFLASGVIDPLWPPFARGVSTATEVQNASGAAIADGSGGLIVAWSDTRSGPGNDIYAQRVQANGQLGGTVLDVPDAPSGPLSLDAIRPNPTRLRDLRVLFSGSAEWGSTLELLDISGRMVASRELSSLGEGEHEVSFEDVPTLTPGL